MMGHGSLSAPTSPEHAPQPPPRSNLQLDTLSSRGSRPLSMAIPHSSETPLPPLPTTKNTTGTTYADLKFSKTGTKIDGGPVPLPRRNTNYTEICKPIVKPDLNGCGKRGPHDMPPPAPVHNDFTDEFNLPPIPPRNEFDHLAHLPLPPTVNELDLQFGGMPPNWNFDSIPTDDGYLREINTNPLYSNNEINELGSFPDLYDNTDVTGGSSAYEDSSLIIAAINRGKQISSSNNNDTTMLMMQSHQQGNSHSGYTSPVFDIANDLSENDKITMIDSRSSTPPINDAYQFPSELDIHPVNYNPSDDRMNDFDTRDITGTSTQPDLYDEPPMGLLSFPSKQEKSTTPPPPLYSNLFGESHSPPAIGRSSSVEPVPRPRMNTSPVHTINKASAPVPMKRNEPPLPPRNLRTNGQQNKDPPLPPRNPPTRVNASPGPPGVGMVHIPPTQRVPQREQTILNLVKLGYSRSEVVKALIVAQNSPDLAKNILESFGSRKD